MDMRKTAFASDYDGTLCISNWITGEERFDPAVLDAVRRYQEAGGLFGICTGRPAFSVVESLEGILSLDFYIASTGAQVLDRNRAPLFELAIDRDVAQQLFERYASSEVAFLAVTDSAFYSVGGEFSSRMIGVGTLDEVPGKILSVSLECYSNEDLARTIRDEMNELYGSTIEGFQNLGSVDVVARGCSKGSGVKVVHEALGATRVAGAGDSYNDLALLTTADVSYTFHSSPDEVKDSATHVVRDLAEALDRFMREAV